MAGVPGQRAVQRPMQAAMATQRALGRAVTTNLGDPVPPRGVAWLNGQWFDVDLSGGVPRLTPRGPVVSTPPKQKEPKEEHDQEHDQEHDDERDKHEES